MRTIMRNPCDFVLYAPDAEGASGGGGAPEKTFTQAELDAILQKRIGPMTEKLKAYESQLATLPELSKKLEEAEAAKIQAAEEAELKGKSEAERLKHQMDKLQKSYKDLETERARSLAEKDALVKAAEQKHTDFVRRERAQAALFDAGVIKGASKHAVQGFLSDAEIELSEDGAIARVTVGGKPFDKPVDAAKEWLASNPYFAEAPAGGSGGPRSANGAPRGRTLLDMSPNEAFQAADASSQ